MSFQFNCPNGHLLEADDSQAGQTCVCPHCSVTLVIPGTPAAPPPVEAPAAPPSPEIYPEFAIGDVGRTTKSVMVNPDGGGNEQLLHIPCPNGHILDTPLDMLDDDVLCPHCEKQFRLLERNSVEYKRRQELEEDRKERRANKFWLNFAIIAAIIFVFGLILMVVASSN